MALTPRLVSTLLPPKGGRQSTVRLDALGEFNDSLTTSKDIDEGIPQLFQRSMDNSFLLNGHVFSDDKDFN